MPAGKSAVKPFWHRLNKFFAFPFQGAPLVYGLVLAFCSLLPEVFFFLPRVFMWLIVEIGILLAASRYGFKVAVLGSRGISRASDFPSRLDDEWSSLPWKLFGVFVVQGFVLGLVASVNAKLATAATFVLSFLFPATVIVLVQSGSAMRALNPAAIWGVVRVLGAPYLALCLFLFLLSSGAQVALALLLPLVSLWLLVPLFNFAFIYFGWVMASLLGYVMYQHHEGLDIDLLPGAGADEAPPERRSPEQIARQETDALVAELVTEGDIPAALTIAYEDQRLRPNDVAALRRYHRVLLMDADKTPTLLEHAKRLIALLLQQELGAEAVKAWQDCRAREPAFVIEDAGQTLALARAAWRAGDAQAALAMLRSFDKRFRGHAAIPQAYELIARVLTQGMHRADMARPVLAVLEERYPDSEATREVRWLLRDPV
ncbi:tetratricopeptide repeat protein [Polaromonas sp. YR568]|uniref:tetratricopeptide repeat protein n=1 Tax=Polaromonas sp. YR568 TaxID=1855301 RepID=UPI00398BD444